MRKPSVKTGEIYGKLTVAERCGTRRNYQTWGCICECGNMVEVVSAYLRTGRAKSCGCAKSEFISQANTRHGMYKHPIYRAWVNARGRCRNPRHRVYSDYGGRGITFSAEWDNFEVFYSELRDGWFPDSQLERIDNNKGYEPGNCKWATVDEQQNNKRNNVKLDTPDGVMTIEQASVFYNLTRSAITHRRRAGKTGSDLVKPSQIKAKRMLNDRAN
jgi:hypothetical protein